MIWRTPDGDEYTKLVEHYGRLLDSSGEEWKEICEARAILAMALDQRATFIRSCAKKRSAGDRQAEAAILAGLEARVTKEWKWRREQKAREGVAA